MYGDCCDDFTADCPDIESYAKKALGPKYVATDVKARIASKSLKAKAAKAKSVKTVRPTKALSKRPKDVKARQVAKKVQAAKRNTRQTKALSKRPVDVDARKASKAKFALRKFARGVKSFAKRVASKAKLTATKAKRTVSNVQARKAVAAAFGAKK